jgi:hypothetical protein
MAALCSGTFPIGSAMIAGACVERFGERPFIVARSERLETVTNIWSRRLAKAFEVAGPFHEPATPHGFRHTSARILLEKGVPLRMLPTCWAVTRRPCASTMPAGCRNDRRGSPGFCRTPSMVGQS